LQTRGELNEAVDAFEELIQKGFKRPAVYFMLADVHFRRQNYQEAIAYLNRTRSHREYLQGD